jgi:hypothetical protein
MHVWEALRILHSPAESSAGEKTNGDVATQCIQELSKAAHILYMRLAGTAETPRGDCCILYIAHLGLQRIAK